MDKETVHHLKELWDVLEQYKEGIAIMFAAFMAMALFWLRNSFVTRQAMKEYDLKNEQSHSVITGKVDTLDDKVNNISQDVAWMRGHMEKLHPEDK